MRQTLLALVVAAVGGFALANCGSSSNNNTDMGKDMAGAGGVGDMAAAKINCLGVGYCIATCTSPDINTCIAMCMKMAKTGSYQKFANAVSCGQNYCAPDPDAGTAGSCVRKSGTSGTYLCDPAQAYTDCVAGQMQNGCTMCLDNAVGAPLLGDGTTPPMGTCTDPNAPSCKGGPACATVMNACISDP
jgi:hypothetical protein